MIAAYLLALLRRQGPLLAIAVVFTVAVVWSWIVWPLEVWAACWCGVMIVGLTLAALFDLGEKGRDR